MHARTLFGMGLAVALVPAACGGHPQGPGSNVAGDPVELVSPETGPSPLQKRLADQAPTPPLAATPASQRLDQALDDFHRRNPSRRAYLAVDKPLYQPGETIWFRAFELLSDRLTPGGDGRGTTFQLIDPRGSVVMDRRVLTQEGAAANDFALPPGMAGGEYTLKALADDGTTVERKVIVAAYQPPRIKKKLEFLRKAYGPGDTVAAAIAVHRGTGEALAAQQLVGQVTVDGVELTRVPVTTDAAGNAVVRFDLPGQMARGDGLLTVLVSDGGITESIQKRIPIVVDKLQLALYPEGGDLVTGLPARVYFAARNTIDKPADVEGRVVDDRGELAARFRSYHDGMGRFELIPRPGRSYKVEITRPVGITQTFAVPAARSDGCTLQSVDDFTSARPDVRVAVWCSHPRAVVATAVLRGKRVATAAALVGDAGPAVLSLATPTGSQGAVRVTLFDDGLAPLAERLIYRNRRVDLSVKLSADRKTYHPRDQVTLAVETRGPDGKPVAADLAVAVVDDTVLSFADDKSGRLLARLYLESEMPGQKVEEPEFYFSDDAQAPAALDLVLGTQGWRRFDWKPVFAGPPRQPIEADWEFTGDHWQRNHKKRITRKVDADKGKVEKEAEGAEELELRQVPADKMKVAVVDSPPPAPPVAAGPPPAREPMDFGGADEDDAPMAEARMEMMAGEAIVLRRGFGARDDNFEIGLEGGQHRIRIRDGKNEDFDFEGQVWEDWAPVRQFPLPSYAVDYDGPRVDFRDTIFWSPQLRTGADGKATVQFPLSDAVTSFRAIAEGVAAGGLPGRGEALIQAKLPVSLAVTLPLEVASGDRIHLPVTISNETAEARTAAITAEFGSAFAVDHGGPASLELAPNQRRTLFYDLRVVGNGDDPAAGKALLAVDAMHLRDQVERTIKVAARGFPLEASAAGTVADHVSHQLLLSDVIPGTMNAKLTLYPSPLATMVEGAEAMIAEPGGCFEQASSTNYPNIMILSYLEEHGAANAELVARTSTVLDHGYKLLTGYESPQKGYEWFGGDPGHEALTAYGLMEFLDMGKVYRDVDRGMVDRTAAWLKNRRDGKGGYQRNQRALDSFGSASPEVTDAYITWALTEAGEKGIDAEVAHQGSVATETKDPYVMALASNTLLNRERNGDAARAAARKLAAMQASDGGFAGADHSITRSGGVALDIESTALAALALMKAGPGYTPQVRKAIEWLDAHRGGAGGFGSTQSTVLSLRAMAAYAKASRQTRASGTVTVKVNGAVAGTLSYQAGHEGAIEFDLGKQIRPGKNAIEITLESKEPLPYSLQATWGSTVPATSPEAKVGLSTRIARDQVPMGETVHMDVRVENRTDKGIPMTLARVGLPGGLTFQTWQLKELRDKKLIDFYETREREVILYFRSMAPHKVAEVPLELEARVPGTYTAPASRAYLYYTDEHKVWVAPTTVTVTP